MDPNPYESPPPLPTDTSGAESTAERLARLRVRTGPSMRWWVLLALAIAGAILLSCVPGLGLLVVIVATPLLFYVARQDCQHPPSDYNREPLNLAGQVAASIAVLCSAGVAFAGVCTPISFSLMYFNNVAIGDEIAVPAVFGLSGLAALAVLYAGYRTIRAASSPVAGNSTLPDKFTLPREALAPQPTPPDPSPDESPN